MYSVGNEVKLKTLSQLRLEFGMEDVIGIDIGFCVDESTTAWITMEELRCLGKNGIIEAVEQVSEFDFRYDVVTEKGTISHIPHHIFTAVVERSFEKQLRELVESYENIPIKDCTAKDIKLYVEIRKCLES